MRGESYLCQVQTFRNKLEYILLYILAGRRGSLGIYLSDPDKGRGHGGDHGRLALREEPTHTLAEVPAGKLQQAFLFDEACTETWL